jgi:AcrR family transcriptional regulator
MTPDSAASTPTRRRVLDAGLELWHREPPATLFGGFTVARVAKAAGVTRATFYSYWPSAADYMDDLLDHLADLDPEIFDDAVEPVVRTVEFASHDLVNPFLAACDAQLQAVIDDPALRLRLGFLSKMDDPHVAERLRERYRNLEDRQWKPPARMLRSWGREVRPPLEPHQLVAIHSCIQEGLAARHVIDPDAVPVRTYGYLSLALLMLLTRRVDDDRTIDDVIGVADTWPTVGLQLLAKDTRDADAARHSVDTKIVRDMTFMARRILGSLSWEDLHLADVGRAVHASEELAIRAFGSKAGLGVSIVSLSIDDRMAETPRTDDAVADIRTMLTVMREELSFRPSVTQSILILFARDTQFPSEDLMVWSPIPRMATMIRSAIAAGQLSTDLDPRTLAWTLSQVILLDSAPGLRGPREVPDAAELVLRGAGAAPEPA